MPSYEERVEGGSDLAFSVLGGDHIEPMTGQFRPGHEDRVGRVRQALGLLRIPASEIEDAIALGEMYAQEHARQLHQIALYEQTGFRE